LIFQTPHFESRLALSVHLTPPDKDASAVISTFDRQLHSKVIFNQWVAEIQSPTFTFDDLSRIKDIKQFIISRDPDELLALMSSDKKAGHYINARTNDPEILTGLYTYAQFIKINMTTVMLKDATDNLAQTKVLMSQTGGEASPLVTHYLNIQKFISRVENGEAIFSIAWPTLSVKTGPKTSLILALSVVIGGMAGVVFVLMRNAIANNQKRKANASQI
jgi:hypothetical protein